MIDLKAKTLELKKTVLPQIGDITTSRDRGGKVTDWTKWIWSACECCGTPRWVRLDHDKPKSLICRKCFHKGDRNPNWIDGTAVTDGYRHVYVCKGSPYYAMADAKERVREHRFVMACYLHRCLSRKEQVHHKNGDKLDNRIENLELISPRNHSLKTTLCSDCELRKEIRLLKWKIRELEEQNRVMTTKIGGIS